MDTYVGYFWNGLSLDFCLSLGLALALELHTYKVLGMNIARSGSNNTTIYRQLGKIVSFYVRLIRFRIGGLECMHQ
jgi:hypothetical protein